MTEPLSIPLEVIQQELSPLLSSEQLKRFIQNPKVSAAIEEALDRYDTIDDQIKFVLTPDRLLMEVVIGKRILTCGNLFEEELTGVEQKCKEHVEVDQEFTLEFSSDAWASEQSSVQIKKHVKPRPEPKKTKSKKNSGEKPTVTQSSPLPNDPNSNQSFMKTASPNYGLFARCNHILWVQDKACYGYWDRAVNNIMSEETKTIIIEYAEFQEQHRTGSYDPFVPENRLRPPPYLQGVKLEMLDEATPQCFAEFKESQTGGAIYPGIDCFLLSKAQDEIETDTLKKTVDFFSTYIPFLNAGQSADKSETIKLRALLVEASKLIATESIPFSEPMEYVWCLGFFHFSKKHPEEMEKLISRWSKNASNRNGVPSPELAALRRFIYKYWQQRAFEEYHPIMKHILYENFLDLYPEARGKNGLPLKSAFTSSYIWASNWMAYHKNKSEDEIRNNLKKLPIQDQGIIFALTRQFGNRYGNVTQILDKI